MRVARTYYDNRPVPQRTAAERATARAEAGRRAKEADAAIAAQRARIAALRPANDNSPRRYRGGLPVLNWLAKKDPAAAWAVRAYGQAADTVDQAIHDDDDAPEADDMPAYGTGSDVDRVHGIRPTLREMLVDLLRVRVVTDCRKDGGSGRGRNIVHRVDGMRTRPAFDGYQASLAGMRFNYHPEARRPAVGGLMVAYTDEPGRERIPKYDTSKIRGAANDDDKDWCGVSGDKEGVTRPIALPDTTEIVEQNDILEMVLAGMTLRAIGLELGYGEHYADRGAARSVIKAATWAKERYPTPVVDTLQNVAA